MPILDVSRLMFLIPAILIALTVHEFAHARVAELMGDSTARAAGRVSLNPAKHLDVTGSLLFLLVGFGWGKPVPINGHHFNNPRQGMFLVSLAGPGSNMLVALVLSVGLRLAGPALESSAAGSYVLGVMIYAVIINIILAIFNLLPIPPLDGSKILASLMPEAWLPAYLSFERYGTLLLFLAIVFFSSAVSRVMSPISGFFMKLLLPS